MSKIIPNPTSADSFKRFRNRRISDSIFLQPTEPGEILNTTNSLNVRKSSSFDHIPPFFVKLAGSLISEPFLSRQSLDHTRNFPEVLKVAKVIPVYKSGSRHNSTNYHPISLLSCFAKIFEKLLYKRLDIFIRMHSIIAPTQYGFKPALFTMHAVTYVLTLVYDNTHEKKYSGLIFLDIQKAFDTVDHNILIAKLKHYGIRGIAKNLFKSYFQNGQQFVALDDESRLYTTNWGVSQGSTLGPLLFLIYINDLITCTSVTPRLFADDTCLCFSLPKPENLQEIINSALKIVSEWITANKLRINAQKSSVLIISPKINDKAPYQNLTILFDGFKINLSKSVKYLGVQTDDNLAFKTHVNFLYSKLSRTLGVMFKVEHYSPKTYLLLLYNTLFHPHLIYYISAWSSTFSTYLNPLQTLQN